MEPRQVELRLATPEEAGLLSDLLDIYMRELKNAFSIRAGPDGRFRYEKLPLYWEEPGRLPFLICSGGDPAGFVLATRGSPATDDPEDLDVAEFFILSAHRRAGVGRRAASILWNRLPGRWVVRVAEANAAGLGFWSATVREYTGGAFAQERRLVSPHAWQVFTFTSGKLDKPIS